MEPEDRDARFVELKDMLLSRGYTSQIIEAAIAKARAIPRLETLKCVSRPTTTDRPTYVVLYDRRLPLMTDITRKHWRSMVNQSNQMLKVFPENHRK